MRLWHTKLIEVLPRQQLLGQWRELNSIYKKQDIHILINFIYEYPKDNLYSYSMLVIAEMKRRGYKMNLANFNEYFKPEETQYQIVEKPFKHKMTLRYLVQCYHNLEEKYDCGGISRSEWLQIREAYNKVYNNI